MNTEDIKKRIHGAQEGETVNFENENSSEKIKLSDLDIGIPLRFKGCSFPDGLDLRRSRCQRLEFENCTFKFIKGQSVEVASDLIIRDSRSYNKVGLRNCRIGGELDFRGSRFRAGVDEKAITLSGAVILGNALLGRFEDRDDDIRETFWCFGRINLRKTKVGGRLDFSGAILVNKKQLPEKKPGYTISAVGMTVGRSVCLRRGFVSYGKIRFDRAHIRGDLNMIGENSTNSGSVRLINRWKIGTENMFFALTADTARIKGRVLAGPYFKAEGGLRFHRAWIGSDFAMRGTEIACTQSLQNADVDERVALDAREVMDVAISAGGIRIDGHVFLITRIQNAGEKEKRECLRFVSNGEIHFRGAKIKGHFVCKGVHATAFGKHAINARQTSIFGAFSIDQADGVNDKNLYIKSNFYGEIDLRFSHINSYLSMKNIHSFHSTVNIETKGPEFGVSDEIERYAIWISHIRVAGDVRIETSKFAGNGITLQNSKTDGVVEFSNVKFSPNNRLYSINISNSDIGSDFIVKNRSELRSPMHALSAKIGGRFLVIESKLFGTQKPNTNEVEPFRVIEADGVHTTNGFHVEDSQIFGRVRLIGATISGRFRIVRSLIYHRNGPAIEATAIKVDRSVNFTAVDEDRQMPRTELHGGIILRHAVIGENLDLRGAVVSVPESDPKRLAINFSGATIGNDAMFNCLGRPGISGGKSDGRQLEEINKDPITVRTKVIGRLAARGAKIGANLDFRWCIFDFTKESAGFDVDQFDVDLRFCNADGTFYWSKVNSPNNKERLFKVNVSHARFGRIEDSPQSWGLKGDRVFLDRLLMGNEKPSILYSLRGLKTESIILQSHDSITWGWRNRVNWLRGQYHETIDHEVYDLFEELYQNAGFETDSNNIRKKKFTHIIEYNNNREISPDFFVRSYYAIIDTSDIFSNNKIAKIIKNNNDLFLLIQMLLAIPKIICFAPQKIFLQLRKAPFFAFNAVVLWIAVYIVFVLLLIRFEQTVIGEEDLCLAAKPVRVSDFISSNEFEKINMNKIKDLYCDKKFYRIYINSFRNKKYNESYNDVLEIGFLRTKNLVDSFYDYDFGSQGSRSVAIHIRSFFDLKNEEKKMLDILIRTYPTYYGPLVILDYYVPIIPLGMENYWELSTGRSSDSIGNPFIYVFDFQYYWLDVVVFVIRFVGALLTGLLVVAVTGILNRR